MHISFTKHDPRISASSKGVLEYLEKENYGREKNFEDLEESTEFDFNDQDKQVENQNLFFSNVKDDQEIFVSMDQAAAKIDKNLSYRAKENESKFFMLNISPGLHEINHLNKIVDLELKSKGIGLEEQEVLNNTEEGKKYLELIKNDLIHQTLREYTRDVMKNYAANFDRNVYQFPEKLPNQKQEKEINTKAKNQLEKDGILPEQSEYLVKYQDLRERFAKEIGKDFSVRKMNENDLVWFAKVEEKRTYKGNDSYVISNKKKLKRIDQLGYSAREDIKKEIEDLKRSLFKDRVTREVITEGMAKGGQQYHVHVIVSRYDNCPDRRHRKSISPLANHRGGTVANKNIAVGFDRNNFFKTAEQSFDQKFQYQRTRSYEKYNQQKKERREALRVTKNPKKSISQKLSKSIYSQLSSPIKQEILRNSGIQELSKLNIMNGVSNELGFRIPMSIPKTPLEASYRIVRAAVGKILNVGKGH